MKYLDFVAKGARITIKMILQDVVDRGLKGNSHFYIMFCTKYPGVQLSSAMKASYPERIIIVLQNDFHDLKVFEDYFQVTLSFNEKYEIVKIPFESIYKFEDPSESFGLEFSVEVNNLLLEKEFDNVVSIESLRNKID